VMNMRGVLSLLTSAWCISAVASGAEDPLALQSIAPHQGSLALSLAGEDPASIDRYLLARGASGAQLSPDGKTIAFRYGVTGIPQLWVMPSSGGQPTQLTFGNGVTFFAWLANGRDVLYGADNNGDEQESYTVISVDGRTEHRVLEPISGGFRSFGDLSKDGQFLYYASTERNGLDFDIYRTRLSTGESQQIWEGRYGNTARALSPDGRWLVITEAVGEDSDNLFLLDTQQLTLRTISKPTPRANHGDGGFAWLPDSSGFYFATNRGREYTALSLYTLSDGLVELQRSREYDIADIHLCGAQSQTLLWTENRDGFEAVWVKNRGTEAQYEVAGLFEGTHAVSCSEASETAVITTNGWRTPGTMSTLNVRTGAVKTLFESTLAGLNPDRLVRPESIHMTARDGVELQGLLYLPDDSSRRDNSLPPVLFEVHGGPTAQAKPTFDGVTQYHVDRGIAVFKPNVRGSTGFGRSYAGLDDREGRLDSVRDLIDMLDGLGKDGRVDIGRAVVAGGSYGGYMVNAVLAAYPNAFTGGVSRYGVADWVTALEVASPGLKASDLIEYGDIKDPRWRAFYTKNSPIQQADAIKVPVLYSHGEMDPRIDIAETETMVRALRSNGVEAVFIRIPDEGHGWRKLANRQFYYRRQAAFVERQLFADNP